jgi:hypothetical protein
MVKKFTLSAPDELAEKIEEHRGSLGNLSAIFQEAVKTKIEKKEEFKLRVKETKDMPAIIERLRTEKMEAERNFFEKGKTDGLQWAQSASYTDLKYASQCNGVTDEFGHYTQESVFEAEVLGDYFRESIMSDPFMALDPDSLCPSDGIPDFAEDWLEGWFDGVQDFWEEVEDKL